ncbi:MAG TPA: hypothetical protein VEC35_21635 [Noviherbaspirillum sp.]|nr:hypothetical protein [Noviherbaspirillum sp.]
MANREDLLIIRAARAGEATAQLKLGKRYLFGGAGLPKSLPTALYWLDRAAQQDEQDAWMLIGRHVPFETVQQSVHPGKLYVWYERAFEAGVAQAGLVLAKLVLGQVAGAVSESMRSKALRALQAAAQAGIAEAQWMLAQSIGHSEGDSRTPWPGTTDAEQTDNEAMLEWATRAARSGVTDAQFAMADHAWARDDLTGFLQWALPLARGITEARMHPPDASARESSLVLRTAHALSACDKFDAGEVARMLEWAAETGSCDAQYSLGLWLAHMDADGKRLSHIPGPANYKRALRWLTSAAEQGLAAAWYALSRIYLKTEHANRNPAEGQRCLEKAAQAGHGMAQLEIGVAFWRARRDDKSNDVRAAAWLLKARSQGVAEASCLLDKITARSTTAEWAASVLAHLPRDALARYPLLVARLELAARFGLSRAEALLIDPVEADCEHCLVVDVCAQHPHSKRRLVLVQTAEERKLLDRVSAVFERLDRGPEGPEGNYRQRLYRLKTLAAPD